MSFRAARSPQRVECGSTDYDEDGHIDGMSVYCQGGQSQVAPTVADDAHYTTPTSSWTEMTRTGQAPCEQGYYCVGGAKIECGSGDYDEDGRVDGMGVFCSARVSEPTFVQTGYYSTGYGNLTSEGTTRTGEEQCDKGYYAVDGVRAACPAGRYGDTVGLSSADCSGECSTGYFCPEGSTGPQQDSCGVGQYPAQYYCPVGTTERIVVDDGFYSVPEGVSALHRTGQAPCPQQYECVNGTRYELLSWEGGCEGGPLATTVPENVADAEAAALTAVYFAGADVMCGGRARALARAPSRARPRARALARAYALRRRSLSRACPRSARRRAPAATRSSTRSRRPTSSQSARPRACFA